jgi:hypothetical protein
MHKKLLWLVACVLFVAVPATAETAFRCESMDGKYRECRAVGDGNLYIAKQMSDAKCIQGETWGYRDGMIWVDRGCRADFRFTPLDQLNMLVLCESRNGDRSHCAADTTTGVRLARQISDSACRFGRDWGYDESGIWVTNGCRAEFGVRTVQASLRPLNDPMAAATANATAIFKCESQNNSRKDCNFDTRQQVTLVRQLSENPCVLNRTWGVDDDGVWVTEGCRGEFALNATQTSMISSSPSATVITTTPVNNNAVVLPSAILCESKNNGRSHCRVDTSMGITLVRKISENECVRDRTWGVDRDGIWVSGGCRAEFAQGTDHHASAIMPPAAPTSPVYVCESLDGKRNHCALDTTFGVNLLRQISTSECLLNQTWGVDPNGIWVSGGCRGEFTLGNARIHLGNEVPSSARVLCESVDGKRTVCPADTRMGVAVVRQISDSACKLNSTWGFDANGIWVTAGCRAEFVLRR